MSGEEEQEILHSVYYELIKESIL